MQVFIIGDAGAKGQTEGGGRGVGRGKERRGGRGRGGEEGFRARDNETGGGSDEFD